MNIIKVGSTQIGNVLEILSLDNMLSTGWKFSCVVEQETQRLHLKE